MLTSFDVHSPRIDIASTICGPKILVQLLQECIRNFVEHGKNSVQEEVLGHMGKIPCRKEYWAIWVHPSSVKYTEALRELTNPPTM
jgi:hypothetical protein